DLDEVVLVQAPTSLASATQRIGRAGHGVGEISRARFLSIAPRDLLDAAVIARGVREGALEAARPIDGALDVLAQTIVATVATKSWRRAELYDVVTRSHAYRDLTRAQFDLVIAMLAGLSGARRLTAFKPLIFADSASDTLHALPGAETRLYLSGGTIPDRGYFHLRLADSGALIGELDEEFVWERSLGDSFSLGPQNWRIERVTRNDVFVTPTARGAAMAPFWRAEERFRPRELMARTASFLSEAEQRLPDLAWRDEIMGACSLTAGALRSLLQFLAEQKAALDGHLPHQTQWIIERVRGGQEAQTILHTLAGGRVNHPLALMLQASASTARRGGERVETIVTDDAITFLGREDVDLQAWIDTALQSDPLTLVREGLPKTPIFGARFREAAQIALLLPRDGFERRTPLWLQRERAKQLLSSVAEHDDFPLMLEAWRACLQDVFDLDTLQETCDGLRAGRIRIHEAVTDHPSPFSAQSQWRRTNQLMYADDMPLSPQRVRTRMDLIREVALRPELRPTSDPKQADILRSKLQRTYPGYAPSDAIDLMALVEARVLVPLDEWQALLDACERDGQDRASWLAEIGDRLLLLERAGSEGIGCVTTEGALKRLWPLIDGTGRALEVRTLSGRATDAHSIAARAHDAPRSEASAESRTQTAADLIEAWLSHYGPISIDTPPSLLLLSDAVWQAALATLVDEERVIVGDLCGRGEELCVTANYERLVRQARTAARPTIVAQKVDRLPLYLATWQGLIRREAAGADEECLPAAIESLFGCPAPVALWETDLLPARVPDYRPADLDALLAEGDLVALGCGEERIAFVLESDRELFAREETEATQAIDASAIFPSTTGRYTFAELLAHSRRDSAGLTRALWSLLWQGRAITDGFEVIRRGIDGRFAPAEVADDARPRRMGRLSRSRWSASRPFGGTWRLLAPVAPPCDALEEDERSRERLRLLLNCYGIVFREIVEREWGGGSWARAFRSLRLMELSGEIVMGRFFEGIPGPQFAILQAIEVLTSGLDEGAVYAMNAVDPASPCGLSLAGTTAWPRRLPSTQMIFQGERLVLVAEQGGKKLAIRISADDERLGACLDPWIAQLTRAVRPLKALQIDTVNDIPAARSPYLAALEKLAQVVRDPLSVRLMRRYA
ncbi:MAG: hypothetical protein MUF51_08415, partial [Vicinamibacteria bacterium]|nr:hypothetical protein [Vicinamibacteria bacterium]